MRNYICILLLAWGLMGIALMAVIVDSFRLSKQVQADLQSQQPVHWSKWSVPYDTARDGWSRDHGIVQYRTNLDTGLVEERSVQ
jgi:hypothetical protein